MRGSKSSLTGGGSVGLFDCVGTGFVDSPLLADELENRGEENPREVWDDEIIGLNLKDENNK